MYLRGCSSLGFQTATPSGQAYPSCIKLVCQYQSSFGSAFPDPVIPFHLRKQDMFLSLASHTHELRWQYFSLRVEVRGMTKPEQGSRASCVAAGAEAPPDVMQLGRTCRVDLGELKTGPMAFCRRCFIWVWVKIEPFHLKVWVKSEPPGYGLQVLVLGSIYQGSILATHF